mgnify:CR=1 FL=1
MFKIKTYNQISIKGLERFSRERYEVASEIGHPDAYMLRSQKLHDEAIPDTLLAVARAGAGVNNLPVDEYSKRGIVAFNTPGANANAVKELVLAALLLGSRDIVGGMDFVQTLTEMEDAGEMSKLLEKEKKRFAGNELQGRTLGVVGLGAIGSMVAEMALALGMKVMGFDPALSVEAAWRLPSQVERKENLQALLSNADFVSLHVPAIAPTHHMINDESLQSVPRILVLNKLDLVESRDELQRVVDFAESQGLRFFAISTITGEGIPELINYLGYSVSMAVQAEVEAAEKAAAEKLRQEQSSEPPELPAL